DPDSLHARSPGSRALDRYRKRLGRCGLRRGRAGDGAAFRSGADATAGHRRRRPDLHLAGDLPRQEQELIARAVARMSEATSGGGASQMNSQLFVTAVPEVASLARATGLS